MIGRWSEYFRRRAIGAAVVAGVVAVVGIFVLRSDARYLFDELTTRALPLVILSAVCGTASLVLLVRNAAPGARLLAIGAVATASWSGGASPNGRTSSPRASRCPTPPPLPATLDAILVAAIGAVLIVLPGFILLYVLDQRSLLPEEGVDVTTPRRLADDRDRAE